MFTKKCPSMHGLFVSETYFSSICRAGQAFFVNDRIILMEETHNDFKDEESKPYLLFVCTYGADKRARRVPLIEEEKTRKPDRVDQHH